MTSVYAALRSGFLENHRTFQSLDPVSMVSYAFLNTLSIVALDVKSVDQFIVLTNDHSHEKSSIKESLASSLNVYKEKIKIICHQEENDSEFIEMLRIATAETKTVMIGALSVAGFSEENGYVEPTINDFKSHFNNGKSYILSDIYQNELFPIEISKGEHQSGFLVDEWNEGIHENVKQVNGVASILAKANNKLFTYHHLPPIQLQHWRFEKEEVASLIQTLQILQVNEKWIVEMDYLSVNDLVTFQEKLKSNHIYLPEAKSGGSLFFGNSKVLNGFRAVTSAMAQLEEASSGKALVIILTEHSSIEMLTLYREKGDEANV